ncbi:GNAT family N-acetyltransferase [Pseudoalteromonas sp. JBTF-M23]|uniref:GNAT family N-acetyltransferase n=1 Tax=Pseudoalteromonas caenipelagi TaxID=2726988 RepID=A0A849V8N3_9GAMM|nr:GNAT family N-acetyltransferase [Pseudoalteromonas caenipelagi]NOU49288.1 GNAT family N-acetyltransferase [Pseudoalteromonas caenipelagi]
MKYRIRIATLSDIAQIEMLIAESARKLSSEDYSKEQIEGALQAALGVDSQLIKDQSYFVIEDDKLLIACGGWSFRSTLFGSDREPNRSPKELNPDIDAAKIRAFFVKPSYARQGLGSVLMQECEKEARAKGFQSLELMATLPGVKLYERHGFVAEEAIEYPVTDTLSVTFVPMKRNLSAV